MDVFSLSVSILDAIQTPGCKIRGGFGQPPFIPEARLLCSRHYLKTDHLSLMSMKFRDQTLEATDPRDRVYGLLGLAPVASLALSK